MEVNMLNDSWIKVYDLQKDQETLVSIKNLLKNAQSYIQIAGDSHMQDLAILRLCLAILISYYSKYDFEDKEYSNKADKTNLLKTWQKLWSKQEFSNGLYSYIDKYADHFDAFGSKSILTVSADEYDKWVPDNKSIETGKGQLTVRMLNRNVSESGNTPSLRSPKSDDYKDQLSIDALVRWLVTYQQMSGTVDKTKVKTVKGSISKGWLFGTTGIYFKGKNLFETLMLNMTLLQDDGRLVKQKPIWEWNIDDYIKVRAEGKLPDNQAELFTLWGRLIHVDWDNNKPTIYSAGLAKINSEDAFVEPMTLWRYKKSKPAGFMPVELNQSTMHEALWRNFTSFVNESIEDDENRHIPGIVSWINLLKKKGYFDKNALLTLASTRMMKDMASAASQLPAFEAHDEIELDSDVLFDQNPKLKQRWQVRIAEVVEETKAVGRDFYVFAQKAGNLQGGDIGNSIAAKYSRRFYDGLNEPFGDWLFELKPDQDVDSAMQKWKKQVLNELEMQVQYIFAYASSSQIRGRDGQNISTLYNALRRNSRMHLAMANKKGATNNEQHKQ